MSSEEEPVAWLRSAILERKARAQAASEGPWDTSEVTPAWAGFRENPLAPANVACVQDGQDYTLFVALQFGQPPDLDEANAAHMALNDPQDTIARCEAELAILDLYERTLAIVRAPVDLKALATEKPVIREMRARDYLDAERESCVLREVVRLLAGGYKHRPGFPAVFTA